ncbi:STAS domain-containing protein [Botrimarina hoheduenensis]|uniref:STAS domain protein n=1 Tax=Botrimarina hoheduenensis TaxID=2528000 RepID=A0A5C5VUN2_9BACT|nr:STAS domain-containing protein [Botrimarina hoheduenensis]TWT41635.1 STAS domain protein [Botrimarina hoheduenensis]
MAISTSLRDGVLVIQVQDQRLLDESQIGKVDQEITAVIEKSEQDRVVFDFSAVQFMSSSMLGKLVAAHKRLKGFKAKLKLAGLSSDIREVFKITKLDKLFDIEPDAATAVKSFAKKGLFR